ncbi:DUF2218 domain-containing protein [Nocardia nepalensis]|uniref:DUF2218 domain-containing protein n=1 Tax=Nocardia nepalensis TaxID=3375448 RepID=UPI003B6858B7
MPTIEADIGTESAQRFLHQFCKHAHAMGSGRAHRMRGHDAHPIGRGELRLHSEWSDTDGMVVFDPWGRCALHAADGRLTVRIEAADAAALQRMREIITRDFDRFGGSGLEIVWRSVDDTGHFR